MLEKWLAELFPPSLKLLGTVWVFEEQDYPEQGSCGPVQRKKYRDGIERTFAEQE